MIREFRVTWSIDVSAKNHQHAARCAETYQRTRGARVFEVVERGVDKAELVVVDLDAPGSM